MTAEQKHGKQRTLAPLRSTQSLLPIRSIVNGIVVTEDGRYIRIMEIKAGAFQIKTIREKMNIAKTFERMLKIAPADLQFTTMTLPADLSEQVEIVNRNLETETAEGCRQMCMDYRDRLIETSNDGLTRRFFLSFEYEKPLHSSPSIAAIAESLNSTAAKIAAVLEQCENDAVISPEDPSFQTAEILYTVLNRRKKIREPFRKHLQTVSDRYMSASSKQLHIPVTDLIAPESMVFRDRRYAVINGTYYTFAYITSSGWCPEVYPGWLIPFINSFNGVDVNIYLNRKSRHEVYSSIRQNMKFAETAMMDSKELSDSYESASASGSAGAFFRTGLQNGYDFYYAAVMITITADSPEEADYKYRELKSIADGMDIRIKPALYQIEQAFFSSLPLVRMDRTIWKKARRNMLTDGAASLYPFTTAEYHDRDGIWLGDSNGIPAVIDPFNKKRFVNANMMLFGITGAGKTFAMFLIASRIRESQIPVYLIMPEKEHEARRLCNAFDGQFIQIAAGSPDRINVMDIYYADTTSNDLIDGRHEKESYLSDKVEKLKAFFSLTIDKMDAESSQLLDQALMETYRKKGITSDNNSIFADRGHTVLKKMPIISDLQNELRNMNHPECLRMANILRIFTDGSCRNFNGQTNVNLNSRFTVFGLEKCSKQMLAPAMYMTMDFVWSRIREDRISKSMLLIDEFWRLAYNSITVEYALEITKLIRGYNGGLVLSTQQMSDLEKTGNPALSSGILNNCCMKIIMKQEKDDAENAIETLKLQPELLSSIVSASQGEALLTYGTDVLALRFKATPTEERLIATDAASLIRVQDMQLKKLGNMNQSSASQRIPAVNEEEPNNDELLEFIEWEN